MPGLMGSSGDIHMMNNAAAAMMMAAAHAHNNNSGGGSPGGGLPASRGNIKLGRGVVDPAAYQHKIFIGQIPFEVGGGYRLSHGFCSCLVCLSACHWRGAAALPCAMQASILSLPLFPRSSLSRTPPAC
jgi:hypothetical protein